MTAPNEYEPSAEAVEALAHEVHAMYESGYQTGVSWGNSMVQWTQFCRNVARFILRRQHAREADAKLALRYLAELGGGNSEGNIYARRALERWERLDAPKVPTLLEAATAYVQSRHNTDDSNGKARAALIAAVEREERKG